MAADPQRVQELFTAAVELPTPEARAAFLDQHCGEVELRARVEALLTAHAGKDCLLDFSALPNERFGDCNPSL